MAIQTVGASALASVLLPSVTPNRATPGAPETKPPEVRPADPLKRASASGAQASPRGGNEAAAAKAVDPDELQRALDEVRRAVEPVARNLQFAVDEDSGRTVVKVIDTSTKEVIRQIPSEEVLSIAKALDTLKGLLIKQEA